MQNTRYNELLRILCDYNKVDIRLFYLNINRNFPQYAIIRHQFFYFIRKYQKKTMSLYKTGALLNKDHATALSGIRNVTNYIDTDKQFRTDMRKLTDRVKPFFDNFGKIRPNVSLINKMNKSAFERSGMKRRIL